MQTNLPELPPAAPPQTPRISIGVPVYNGEPLVCEAVGSLLVQTYRNFELIISDNASTDRTEELCRQFAEADARVRYVRQPKNIGGMPNFEFLLNEARAPYFMWAAHDDRWLPSYLESMVRVLDENPQAESVISKVRFSDNTLSKATTPLTGPPRERLAAFLTDPSDNSRFYGLHRIEFVRKAFRKTNWGIFASDWLFVAELALEGEMLEVPEVLMERLAGTREKYLNTLHGRRGAASWFPLQPFTLRVLAHKEAWNALAWRRLVRLNADYHTMMATHLGWNGNPVYQFAYRALRTLMHLAPR